MREAEERTDFSFKRLELTMWMLLGTEDGVQKAHARLFPGTDDVDDLSDLDLDRSTPVAAQALEDQERREASEWLRANGFDRDAFARDDDDDDDQGES